MLPPCAGFLERRDQNCSLFPKCWRDSKTRGQHHLGTRRAALGDSAFRHQSEAHVLQFTLDRAYPKIQTCRCHRGCQIR